MVTIKNPIDMKYIVPKSPRSTEIYLTGKMRYSQYFSQIYIYICFIYIYFLIFYIYLI